MYVPQNGHQWVNLLFNLSHAYCYYQKNSIPIFAPAHWSLGEIDGLLVPPGKASKLLTDHLITGLLLQFEPAQEKWFSQTIHTYKPYWFA